MTSRSSLEVLKKPGPALDKLLEKAFASIESTFQKRATGGLLAGRGAVLSTFDETPKARIRCAQITTARAVNRELILLF